MSSWGQRLDKVKQYLSRGDVLGLVQETRRFWAWKRTRREQAERLNMSLRQWILHHQQRVVFNDCRWMGVPTWKSPLDAWIYQEIIYEVKPAYIIEIGSAAGGSTLYFAHLLDLLGNGIVISIDIDRSRYSVEHDRIATITGDSSSPEVVARTREICRGKSVLIVHDGGHKTEQVLKDLEAYSTLVSVGSYFIVEDGIIDLFRPNDGIADFNDGPLAAIEHFLSRNSNFVSDVGRERYIATYNPKGFLKRIR